MPFGKICQLRVCPRISSFQEILFLWVVLAPNSNIIFQNPSLMFSLFKSKVWLFRTLGSAGGGGGWNTGREGQTVEWDWAARTCLLTSCQLACRRSHGDSAGTARDSPEQLLLFLPPWRSVSVTKSNFGPRSGGVWDVPHSTPGPVVFRISFKANQVIK